MRNFCCVRCQSDFTSIYKRRFCESCRRDIAKAASASARRRWKDGATLLGQDSDKIGRWLATLTVRTHEEVGAILGIDPQSSRMAERSALTKLRKAFAFELLQKQLDNSLRTYE